MLIDLEAPNHIGLGVLINAWPEAKCQGGSIAEARSKLCDPQKKKKKLDKRHSKVNCLHICMYNLFRALLL